MTDGLFKPAPTEFNTRSVFLTIYGRPSTGKTTFALSAPGPIYLLSANEKIDGIIQPFAREKEIHVYNFALDADNPAEDAKKKWPQFKAAMMEAKKKARTVVVDTASEAYAVSRYFHFGKLTQVKPFHYNKVNTDWAALLDSFQSLGKTVNLICVARIKERYKNDKPTGIMEPAVAGGDGGVEFTSDVVLRARREMNGAGPPKYTLQVEKGWMKDKVALGLPHIDATDAGFIELMGLVTQTAKEEWE